MKKRSIIRMISFCAALALTALGFALKAEQKADRYRLQIENTYSHMLDGLDESMGNISVLLQKAEYTTAPGQLSSMAAQLLGEAQSAKIALSQLPTGDRELTVLNRFLSQVGNYAVSVSKKAIAGEDYTKEYTENIKILKDTAKIISEAVSDSAITYNNPKEWSKEIDRKLEKEIPADSFSGSAEKIEESLESYPTLVYDGPYSDHILEKEAQMIKGKSTVTGQAAKKIAENVLQVKSGGVKADGESEGKIPAYRFHSDNATVSISKQGGYPVYLRKFRAIGDGVLEYEQILEKAKRYLDTIGMSGFLQTYYYTDEGVCVINFAFLDGKTVCYTDLVKVGVAVDNGEIMLLETSGYLTNHTDRAFETPSIDPGEAQKSVNSRLTVINTSLALIPTEGGGEARCYEFLCESEEGQEILVYINAVTGLEENILILLKSDGGTLTK